MSWVILALTLGAAITSIIHGVFMLFQILVNKGAIFELSKTILDSLPVISAVFALIGGIIAFNKSKWGALFLLIAVGLCVPSRDTWLYGGIYFFAMFLCFFLKPDKHDEYDELFYEDEEFEDPRESQPPQYYLGNESENYAEEENEIDYLQGGYPEPKKELNQPELTNLMNIPDPILNPSLQKIEDDDVVEPSPNIPNNERPQLRRRTSKTCPACGATVAREARFCSICGSALLVPAEEALQINSEVNINPNPNPAPATNIIINENDGDDDNMSGSQSENPKVFVKPRKISQDFQPSGSARQRANNNIDAAASSYQEFSKYTRRAKKRKRSAGRKILSMLLLVAVVGGALYFLLGLRKLPPGELPPIAQTAITTETNVISTQPATTQTPSVPAVISETIAEPLAITENVLPNFTPDREPKAGLVVGSNVNVRADHTTSSNRITRLNVNSRVEILGTFNVTSGQHTGIWYNIMTGGKEGWIYGRYVQPVGSGLPQGYSNALLKSFGNDKQQLIDALGQPTRNTSTSAEWPGLTATFKGDEITRLRITNSRHTLQNGLKVGMSQTALTQIMGYPSGLSNRIMQYNEGNKTGLSVQLDRNNAISVITVSQI